MHKALTDKLSESQKKTFQTNIAVTTRPLSLFLFSLVIKTCKVFYSVISQYTTWIHTYPALIDSIWSSLQAVACPNRDSLSSCCMLLGATCDKQ